MSDPRERPRAISSQGGVPAWGIVEMWLVSGEKRSLVISARRTGGLTVAVRVGASVIFEEVGAHEDPSRAALRAIGRAGEAEDAR